MKEASPTTWAILPRASPAAHRRIGFGLSNAPITSARADFRTSSGPRLLLFSASPCTHRANKRDQDVFAPPKLYLMGWYLWDCRACDESVHSLRLQTKVYVHLIRCRADWSGYDLKVPTALYALKTLSLMLCADRSAQRRMKSNMPVSFPDTYFSKATDTMTKDRDQIPVSSGALWEYFNLFSPGLCSKHKAKGSAHAHDLNHTFIEGFSGLTSFWLADKKHVKHWSQET